VNCSLVYLALVVSCELAYGSMAVCCRPVYNQWRSLRNQCMVQWRSVVNFYRVEGEFAAFRQLVVSCYHYSHQKYVQTISALLPPKLGFVISTAL
jgi:hypothetical protein